MNELEKLTKRIQDRHPGCFINDPLTFPLQIGDYGKIKDCKFIRKGNVYNDFDQLIPNPITTDSISNEQIASEKVRTFLVDAKGIEFTAGSVGAKAGIGIRFQNEGSIFIEFSKSECAIIPSVMRLSNHIKDLIYSGRLRWENDYVVVVSLYNAHNIFLITSNKKNTEINLMASADLSSLSDADIRLSNPSLQFKSTLSSEACSITTSPESTYLYEVYQFEKQDLSIKMLADEVKEEHVLRRVDPLSLIGH